MRPIEFPAPLGSNVNMMPVVVGGQLPAELRGYAPVIEACGLRRGATAYLTVSESRCAGDSQRRPGAHTEATADLGWGGGPWGGSGVWMASTDGACRVWDGEIEPQTTDGSCSPVGRPWRMRPGMLYRMSDRTPHEALPSRGYRQFFRLVADEIGGWWERHSTPSAFGVRPNAPILRGSKFT